MKELSRFEIATVKRTAANTKRMRTKKEKLEATVEAASAEIEILQKAIDAFEPIVKFIPFGSVILFILKAIVKFKKFGNG